MLLEVHIPKEGVVKVGRLSHVVDGHKGLVNLEELVMLGKLWKSSRGTVYGGS